MSDNKWPCKCGHIKKEHGYTGECEVLREYANENRSTSIPFPNVKFKPCFCYEYRPKSNFAYLHWFKLYAKKYRLKRKPK